MKKNVSKYAKVLIIGAGAVGCEVLKNLSLGNVGTDVLKKTKKGSGQKRVVDNIMNVRYSK